MKLPTILTSLLEEWKSLPENSPVTTLRLSLWCPHFLQQLFQNKSSCLSLIDCPGNHFNMSIKIFVHVLSGCWYWLPFLILIRLTLANSLKQPSYIFIQLINSNCFMTKPFYLTVSKSTPIKCSWVLSRGLFNKQDLLHFQNSCDQTHLLLEGSNWWNYHL